MVKVNSVVSVGVEVGETGVVGPCGFVDFGRVRGSCGVGRGVVGGVRDSGGGP